MDAETRIDFDGERAVSGSTGGGCRLSAMFLAGGKFGQFPTMRRAQVEDQIRRNSILAGDVAAIQALEPFCAEQPAQAVGVAQAAWVRQVRWVVRSMRRCVGTLVCGKDSNAG